MNSTVFYPSSNLTLRLREKLTGKVGTLVALFILGLKKDSLFEDEPYYPVLYKQGISTHHPRTPFKGHDTVSGIIKHQEITSWHLV